MKIRFGLILLILILTVVSGYAWAPSTIQVTNTNGMVVIVGFVEPIAHPPVGQISRETPLESKIRRFKDETRDTIIFGVPEFLLQNREALLPAGFILLILGFVSYAYERTTHGKGRWFRYTPSPRQALRHALRQFTTNGT
jgi:hypothetical protein